MSAREATHVELDLLDVFSKPVVLDDCERATLLGIVREALMASPRIADWLDFRHVDHVRFQTEMDERTTVYTHVEVVADGGFGPVTP